MKAFFKKIVIIILSWEARMVLARYKPQIIGVTGSVGKTTTKDAIHTAISTRHYARKNQKSFNTEIGVPLTILGLDNAWGSAFGWFTNIIKSLGLILLPNHYPKWLVLEMGLDHPGDIKHLVDWIALDVAVFTQFSPNPVHVKFFESAEALLDEKRLLATALKPDGTLIINEDDPLLASLKKSTTHLITYGFADAATIRASHPEITYTQHGAHNHPSGITFRIESAGNSVPVILPGVLGKQHVYPFLAAVSVGVALDMHLVELAEATAALTPAPGRMRILDGINNTTLIDDSYNASPIAVAAALDVLTELKPSCRKIAILGDMTELGKYSEKAHADIGKQLKDACDIFIAVGKRMERAASVAHEHGMRTGRIITHACEQDVGEYVRDMLKAGDIILIKGSQAMRMERISERILARPERAPQLLVRQDPVWKGIE